MLSHFSKQTIYPFSLFQFGRYSLLSIGIVYGAYHNNRLAKKEVKVREIEAKQKEVRDAKLAIEKKRNQEGESIIYDLNICYKVPTAIIH